MPGRSMSPHSAPPGSGVSACSQATQDLPDLAALPARIWQTLVQGSGDPAHGFHWPVLASLRQPGVPDARTVVLRHADPAGRVLLIHSHRRAGKIGQLQARPPVCLVFHDTASRTQVRAHGEATVHAQDALSAQAWQGLAAHSRGLYQGADDFAVLRVVVGELDWLLLDPAGHRRAGLRWSAGGWQSSWLEP